MPAFTKPFRLAVDASVVAAGVVLPQCDDEDTENFIYYFQEKINVHQKNYSTIEK